MYTCHKYYHTLITRVTPYTMNENYPGGAYPNQAPKADGLVKWTKQDRSLIDTDVVLWHCFGVHHVPR